MGFQEIIEHELKDDFKRAYGTKAYTKVVPLDPIRSSESLAALPPALPPIVIPASAQRALEILWTQGRVIVATFT